MAQKHVPSTCFVWLALCCGIPTAASCLAPVCGGFVGCLGSHTAVQCLHTSHRSTSGMPAFWPLPARCHRTIFHAHFSTIFSTLSPTRSFISFTFLLLSLFSIMLSRYRLDIRLTTLTNFYDLMTIPFILFLFFTHTLSFDEMRT